MYIYIYLCATIDIANFIPRIKVWFSLPNAQKLEPKPTEAEILGSFIPWLWQQIWEVHQESIEHTHTHTIIYCIYIYNVGKIIIYTHLGMVYTTYKKW